MKLKIELPEAGLNLPALLRFIEYVLVKQALDRAGTCEEAAQLLGLKRTALVEKRRKFGLPLADPGSRPIPRK